MVPNSWQRWLFQRWPWCVATLSAVQTAYVVLLPTEQLAQRGVLIDDAYLYAVLARNFPRLGVLSLDGEIATNGVQPLWQAVLIAAEYALPGQDVLRSSLCLSWGLYLLFAWTLTAWFSRDVGVRNWPAALTFAALLCLNPRFQRIALQGLETPLLLVIFSHWLRCVTALWRQPAGSLMATFTWRQAGWLGFCSASLFLTRTDWWMAGALVGAWLSWRVKDRLVQAAFGVACGLPAGLYVSYNWLFWGHPVPVSARMKLFQMQQLFPTLWQYLLSYEWHGLFALVSDCFGLGSWALGLVFCVLLGSVACRRGFEFACGAMPVWLAGAAHSVFMFGYYRELRPYTQYYFCVELIGIVCALGLVVARLSQYQRLQRAWRRPAAALVLAAFVLSAGFIPGISERWRVRIELAKELAALPSNAKIGAFWPGALAHFSGRPVVALDGVVGSSSYLQDVIKAGRELDYARANGITHVAAFHAPPSLIAAAEPPVIRDWAMLSELRMWQGCGYLRGVELERSSGQEQWRVYRLAPDWDASLPCPNRTRPSEQSSLRDL